MIELTKEVAIELHKEMWQAMKDAGGGNTSKERASFKHAYLSEKFPDVSVSHDCWLCEYSNGGNTFKSVNCASCILNWCKGCDYYNKNTGICQYTGDSPEYQCECEDRTNEDGPFWQYSDIEEIINLEEV